MLKVVLDSYSRKARLYPALLCCLPLLLLIPSFTKDAAAIGLPLSIATTCGVGLLLAQLGRDLGRRAEPKLFSDWGGTPTTQFLRHGSEHLSPVTRARYHAALSSLVPGIVIPDKDSELADPAKADHCYSACVDWLREHTRDQSRFPLVFGENVNYGFRRNFWALRRIGLWLSGLAALGSVVALLLRSTTGVPVALPVLSLLVAAIFFILWRWYIDMDWVKLGAFAYAKAVLATCDVLAKQEKPTSQA